MSICDPRDTILGGPHGAGQSSYTLNTGAGVGGVDTITLDSSVYGSSITSASTLSWGHDSWASTTGSANVTINTDGISMEPGTDIVVGGKSLMDSISKIEERLGILHPNPELEDRWDQLKDLRRQYQELEKELLEKEKMWKILKES